MRQNFLAKAEHFKRPAMLTLTVDRSHFGSPVDAFVTITQEGFIRRLMRLLKVERWAWTLEFQMKTGDGWPHWHLIIDLPPGGLDLKRAWHLWRDKWGLGGLDLQRKRTTSARHAIMYATKYITKYPAQGFPRWVLEYDHRIRWVGACKAVGPLVGDIEAVAKDKDEDDEARESPPKEHRPLYIRMADCCQTMNFWREVDTHAGPEYDFIGRLPCETLKGACDAKLLRVKHDDGGDYIELPPDISFTDFAGELLGDLHRRYQSAIPANIKRCHERQRKILQNEVDRLSKNDRIKP